MPRCRFAIESGGKLPSIAPAVIWVMAGNAGYRAVSRPPFVPKELFVQRDLLRHQRIVVRNIRGAFLKTEWRNVITTYLQVRPAGGAFASGRRLQTDNLPYHLQRLDGWARTRSCLEPWPKQ